MSSNSQSPGNIATVAAESRSKEAVRMFVFQLQAELISMDATESLLIEAKDWLSPAHFDKIIDERSFISICGYPSCTNNIGQRYMMQGGSRY